MARSSHRYSSNTSSFCAGCVATRRLKAGNVSSSSRKQARYTNSLHRHVRARWARGGRGALAALVGSQWLGQPRDASPCTRRAPLARPAGAPHLYKLPSSLDAVPLLLS